MQFQTLMLAATVMFGGGLGVITQVCLTPAYATLNAGTSRVMSMNHAACMDLTSSFLLW